MEVVISYEEIRECGYRKPAKDGVGIYLRGPGRFEDCERLPFILDTCPCCGAGFVPARGFTWINPMSLFDPYVEPRCTATLSHEQDKHHDHERCWLCNPELLGSKAGLIWIGEKFYKTPDDFAREANKMGISRKIAAIPNGFEVGTHAIFLAHKKVLKSIVDGKEVWKPGVFMAFKPSYIDLVIDDPNRIPDKAIELAKRLGEDKCRLVKVIPEANAETEDAWGDWSE